MTETVLSFLFASLALALTPGPDNIFVLSQSLANGARSGIITTLGLMTGCVVHTTLLAFGVSALTTSSETLFYSLKLMGTCYLLYLAWRVYRNEDKVMEQPEGHTPAKPLKLFRIGLIMNLVNPKVLIFFLALFPGFIWDAQGNTVIQFYVLGFLFIIATLLVFGLIAILSGQIARFIQTSDRFHVWLKWFQIIVFAGIAVYIAI